MTDSYLRYPHPHDDLVTFVAEDDVWLAPIAGGRAFRVSTDRVPARSPRLSPDGAHIAWTSLRDVAPEVHVAAADGGPSTRLSYWSNAQTEVLGWHPDGRVIARTSAGRRSSRHTWAHALPIAGGSSQPLPYGPLGGLALGGAGGVLLSTVGMTEPAYRKRYRGGTVGKLWLDAEGSGEFARIFAELDGNIESPMWVGSRLAFISDHDGVGHVYSAAVDGTDLRRHTDGEFYARHASTDGTRVVFERAGELWLLDDLDGTAPHRLEIRLGGSATGRVPYPVSAADELGRARPDQTGRAALVEVRGTLHWLTTTEGPARTITAESGVRARLPVVLGESGNVAWVTDADGIEAVRVAPAEGADPSVPPRLIGAGELGHVLDLAAAPDGRHLAVIGHDGRVLLIDAETAAITEVARASEGDPTGPVFSPDSRWLAWSHPGPEPLRHIRLASVSDLSVTDVTELRFNDFNPVFTQDGRYLAFLSVRSFEPVYDVHSFDINFPQGCRPYLVTLAEDTPSPFDPQLQGRPPLGDDDDEADVSSTVDIEGIADRVVPFPVATGDYTNLRTARDAVFWLANAVFATVGEGIGASLVHDKPTLRRFDLKRVRDEEFATEVDAAEISGDGKRVLVRDEHGLRMVPTARKHGKGDKEDADTHLDIDTGRIAVTVDPVGEWRQGFAEAARLMRYYFWRADMNGVDWDAVQEKYRPLLDRVATADDFRDVLWETQGELGTSHAYVIPPAPKANGRRPVGQLGADLERGEDGRWRITRVLPGESSDPKARSPLRAVGVRARVGDAIVAVDGRAVDADRGPAPLLVGSAGQPVELTIAPAGGGATRRVVVTPIADEATLRYQDWVADRRARVHEATDGRVGYLHVPDMIASGWAQLHRDLRLELRREGLLLDVRENRGGHLSQLVVERIGRTVVGWGRARDRYAVQTYPQDAPRGPIVALADEFSGSDGDIVNAAIKAKGIAPIVGVRTWGGTIGIDPRELLLDGTMVTQPRYAHWFEGPGWLVENHGISPDVEVVHAPQDRVAGRDLQLERGIEMVLAALAERPAATLPDLPPVGTF